MIKTILFIALLSNACVNVFGQSVAMTFKEAESKGIIIKDLDSIYKSAVNVMDSSKGIFQTEKEQEVFGVAWINYLKELGKFLSSNNFKWDKPTRCFNRVYFNSDGTVAYFLFNFTGKNEEKLSDENQIKFQLLLNKFIQNNKISMVADSKFAQCGPTTYMPK